MEKKPAPIPIVALLQQLTEPRVLRRKMRGGRKGPGATLLECIWDAFFASVKFLFDVLKIKMES